MATASSTLATDGRDEPGRRLAGGATIVVAVVLIASVYTPGVRNS